MNRFLKGALGALLFRIPFWIVAWCSLPTLCNWDCYIYSQISQHYTSAQSAFFPLFPLFVHAVSLVFPFLSAEHAVVVTSNLFVPIAGALFLFVADGLWDEFDVAGSRISGVYWGFHRRSWLALLLLSIFPEGHFWMRGYSEPLFFALLMGIFLSLQRKRWILAAACSGLIAVTRPQGVWVDAVVGLYFIWRLFKKHGPAPVPILLCGLPFLGFMAWLWAKTGNPIYFYSVQHQWGRTFDVLGALRDQLPRWDASHLYLYLGVWAGIRFIRRPGLDWRLLGILSLVLSELPIFFGGFYSYVRFASVNPALFLLGAELISAAGWATNGVALAVIVWSIVRLAIQVHMAGTSWAG